MSSFLQHSNAWISGRTKRQGQELKGFHCAHVSLHPLASHQPIYRRPDSREYLLPWVNYHLTAELLPMAFLAEEAGFPCTFNFVPCLLEQIEDYCRESGRFPPGPAEADPGKLKPAQVERLCRFLPQGTVLSDPGEAQRLA